MVGLERWNSKAKLRLQNCVFCLKYGWQKCGALNIRLLADTELNMSLNVVGFFAQELCHEPKNICSLFENFWPKKVHALFESSVSLFPLYLLSMMRCDCYIYLFNPTLSHWKDIFILWGGIFRLKIRDSNNRNGKKGTILALLHVWPGACFQCQGTEKSLTNLFRLWIRTYSLCKCPFAFAYCCQ